MDMENNKALVLFSGGLDSMLATCKTIEAGYDAILIHYNNGYVCGSENVLKGYERLCERYGKERIFMWGTGIMTVGFFKALRDEFWQKEQIILAKEAPNLTMGQRNCLACRSAMYVFSILVCMKEDIKVVVDGARRSQGFCLERDLMIQKYKDFFSTYDIQFLVPVLELESDWEREIALYIRGIAPIANESKCWLGFPVTFEEEDAMLKRDLEAVSLWEKELEPKCKNLVKSSKNILLNNRRKLF